MRQMADHHITSNSAKRNARNIEEMLVSEQQVSYLSEHGIIQRMSKPANKRDQNNWKQKI